MSLFACAQCNTVENTALSRYWVSRAIENEPPLCSQCDPKIGKWHGMFQREDAALAGYRLMADGVTLGRIGERDYTVHDRPKLTEHSPIPGASPPGATPCGLGRSVQRFFNPMFDPTKLYHSDDKTLCNLIGCRPFPEAKR